LLETHALAKAQTPDFVRRSQERLVAEPLLERLVAASSKDAVEQSVDRQRAFLVVPRRQCRG
jgi:hypothetical protein